MALFDKEHYDMLEVFEKTYRGYRTDKEDQSLWPKGRIYEHPELNLLFLAFRHGVAYGKTL